MLFRSLADAALIRQPRCGCSRLLDLENLLIIAINVPTRVNADALELKNRM